MGGLTGLGLGEEDEGMQVSDTGSSLYLKASRLVVNALVLSLSASFTTSMISSDVDILKCRILDKSPSM